MADADTPQQLQTVLVLTITQGGTLCPRKSLHALQRPPIRGCGVVTVKASLIRSSSTPSRISDLQLMLLAAAITDCIK